MFGKDNPILGVCFLLRTIFPFFYPLIKVFAIVMDSGVISAPLMMRAISFIRSLSVISLTDVVVLSSVADFAILKCLSA